LGYSPTSVSLQITGPEGGVAVAKLAEDMVALVGAYLK
jgi:hypothetical protein